MNVLTKVYCRYLLWKDNRFLKKHGCVNWKEYNHRFDPDINCSASAIESYYMNYPYVYVIKDPTPEAFQKYDDWLEGYVKLKNWCDNNCAGKWRSDVHRVYPNNFFTGTHTAKEYVMNDIGGYDFIFFAFKNEKDYLWFTMRWT